MRKKLGLLALMLVFLISTFSMMQIGVAQPAQESIDKHGPYVDKIVFKVIKVPETAVLALEAGEVDIYNERVPAELVGRLLGRSDIHVNKTIGIMIRHVSFNCEKFPVNDSVLRRAIALAADKYKIIDEATNGLAVPADTPVPPVYAQYSIEDTFPLHYYDPMIAEANALLDAAGYLDIDTDGYRESPTGQEILLNMDVDNEYVPAQAAVFVMAEACEAIGIEAEVNFYDWELVVDRFLGGEFLVTCFSWSLGLPDPDQLYDLWRTGQLYNELVCRFHNSTYDMYADALMAAETLEEAQEAAAMCQQILMEQQPLIVCYVDSLTHAYRIDDWEGWQFYRGTGFTESEWSWYKVRLKEEAGGPLGGTLTVAQPEPLETSNILDTDDGYTIDVFDLVYQPLFEFDPYTWAAISGRGLATDWTVEDTTTPEGDPALKATFNLLQNATFHDGVPVTSADVKFTIDLIMHIQAPFLYDYAGGVYKVETPDDYTIEIYSNKTGLFEFHRFASLCPWILPKHIWEPHWDDALTWVPEMEDLVGSNAFYVSDWVVGEYIELSAYDQWPYRVIPTSGVTVKVNPTSISEGETCGVTATITNTGAISLTDVSVTITLPSGTSLSTGTDTASIGRIAAGGSDTATWIVKGDTAGTYTFTVDMTSDQLTGQGSGSLEVVTYIYYYAAAVLVVAIVIVGGYLLIKRR